MKPKTNHAKVCRLYRSLPAKQVQKLTGLKWSTIRTIVQREGVKRGNHRWEQSQINYLMKNYPARGRQLVIDGLYALPIQEIANHIGKTKWACVAKFREISLTNKNKRDYNPYLLTGDELKRTEDARKEGKY